MDLRHYIIESLGLNTPEWMDEFLDLVEVKYNTKDVEITHIYEHSNSYEITIDESEYIVGKATNTIGIDESDLKLYNTIRYIVDNPSILNIAGKVDTPHNTINVFKNKNGIVHVHVYHKFKTSSEILNVILILNNPTLKYVFMVKLS